MKYNKCDIMKKAWQLVKEYAFTFSLALKLSWSMAKGGIRVDRRIQEYAKECGYVCIIGGVFERLGKSFYRTYALTKGGKPVWIHVNVEKLLAAGPKPGQ